MSEGLTPEQRKELGFAVTTVLFALNKQIQNFNANAQSKEVSIRHSLPSGEVQRKCVQDLSAQLNEHVKTYCIRQTRIDFFKVAAWLGMMLYKNDPKSFLLFHLVSALNAQLMKEGRQLPSEVRKKIAAMLLNDGGEKDNVAIGKNGLYMIFRSAFEVEMLPSV